MKLNLILIVCGICLFFYYSSENTAATSVRQNLLTKERSVSKAGYSFRSIAGWTTTTLPDGTTIINQKNDKLKITPGIIITISNTNKIFKRSDQVKPSTSGELFETFYRELSPTTITNQHIIKQEIRIGDKIGYSASFSLKNFRDTNTAAAGQFAATLIDNNKFLTVLGISSPPESWHYDKEFEAVLSSIQLFQSTNH